MKFSVITNSKEETIALGKELSKFLNRGDVCLLSGDLGAGKTTFVGGIAKGLNIHDNVLSPTFNILKCYFNGRIPLYHIDADRLEDQNIEIGLDEFIEGDGICFIEWPVYIASLIPEEHLEIEILNLGENQRKLTFISQGENYKDLFQFLEERK